MKSMIALTACLLFSVLCSLPASAEQLEMDVITVYGKESYRFRKEIFEVLAPMRKEDMSALKVKKKKEDVAPPPEVGVPAVAPYDTGFEMRPSGEIASIGVVRTGLLVYFMMRGRQIENLHLEFAAEDGTSQDFYLKRVAKDQYVEVGLAPGRYKMTFSAETLEQASVDSLLIRSGQISLALVPVQEKIAPPPPPPVVIAETLPPPPPPPPEKIVTVQLVPLRKVIQQPRVQPTMVARGKLRMREKGVPNVQMRLYEKEVDFFDPYNPKVEDALLAVTLTDEEGNFEFPPIDNDDGFLEGTRDPVVVMSLENSRLSVMRPLPTTQPVPYRYVVYQTDNVHPDAGNLQIGTIDVKLRKELPVMLFEACLKKSLILRTPLRILYPGSPIISFARRQLNVPQNTTVAEVMEYLDYLSP